MFPYLSSGFLLVLKRLDLTLILYASGENTAVANAIKEVGLLKQLKFHSHTSQYGQMTRGLKLIRRLLVTAKKIIISHIKF
jgi:ketol-acid reductoisomerase